MLASIKQIEYYLPERIESNTDLLKDNPDWDISKIVEKTGVISRRVAGKFECASDLAVKAAEKLFENKKNKRSDIDMLIFCTQSPDYFLPTTACIIQEQLHLRNSTGSFDINLGCSGYIYGLAISTSMINAGLCSNILLLCADTYTKFIKKNDRVCRPLFGDAGTATLLTSSTDHHRIGPFVLGTDGRGKDKLIVRGGGLRSKEAPLLEMDGSSLFMFALSEVPACVKQLLKKANKEIGDVDLFVFHQASKFIIDNITRKLSLPESKVFVGFKEIGNTVSSSIPIALKQAAKLNKLKKNDLVMLVGFGVGYSWGACLINWSI